MSNYMLHFLLDVINHVHPTFSDGLAKLLLLGHDTWLQFYTDGITYSHQTHGVDSSNLCL